MDQSNDCDAVLASQCHEWPKKGSLSLAIATPVLQTMSPSMPVITAANGETSRQYLDCEKHEYEESEKSTQSNKNRSHTNDWEILEGLKDGQRCEERPNKFDGVMLKRRKWPLKGWHKRHFSLEKGILSYSRSATDMFKGKIHGSVDVGLSVISTKRSSKRIDIDAEEFIYHLKVKNRIQFMHWVAMLRHHRLYRQHQIAFGNTALMPLMPLTPVRPIDRHRQTDSRPVRPVRPIQVSASTPDVANQSKVANWLLDLNNLSDSTAQKIFSDLQVKLVKLSSLLQTIEIQVTDKNNTIEADVDTASLKKHRRRFLLRRNKKTNVINANITNNGITATNGNNGRKPMNANVDIVVNDTDNENAKSLSIGNHLSSSHPVLNETNLQPNSYADTLMARSLNNETENDCSYHLSSFTPISPTNSLHDFVTLANDVNNCFRTLLRSIQTEYSKRGTNDLSETNYNNNSNLLYSLRQSLKESMKQNCELKCKLDQIHSLSETSLISGVLSPETSIETKANSLSTGLANSMANSMTNSMINSINENDSIKDDITLVHQPLAHSTSRESSSVLSVSEYFDAEENLSSCTTSTEDEDEESLATDISDDATEYGNLSLNSNHGLSNNTGRRAKLPAPQPDTGDFSLWNILCKNIGKDLSKISMPVTINEPLNVLQRLCEELEYSELLDRAAAIEDSCERMLCVVAFAVSAYSSSYYRAGHKPFNPLLGETYECLREDKGFQFMSEQVSHHPPVSACHAQSDNYLFWQDIRIKSKFWGKSMEIIPFGTVHVYLKAAKCHYRWNKVTTCVHNLFKGQRWADQYGEMTITDGELTCKLTFEKASYWSSAKHEINGIIVNARGDILERIFGKWNESLHSGVPPRDKCIWRPGAMPQDYHLYYGFSRFAIELNELTPQLTPLLPPSDTRFRPDQRLLEEGDIENAERVKLQLEQQQRERRKKRDLNGHAEHHPLWFRKDISNGEETWVFTDHYWSLRQESGFSSIQFEQLW